MLLRCQVVCYLVSRLLSFLYVKSAATFFTMEEHFEIVYGQMEWHGPKGCPGVCYRLSHHEQGTKDTHGVLSQCPVTPCMWLWIGDIGMAIHTTGRV
jgi:hypothetical protein